MSALADLPLVLSRVAMAWEPPGDDAYARMNKSERRAIDASMRLREPALCAIGEVLRAIGRAWSDDRILLPKEALLPGDAPVVGARLPTPVEIADAPAYRNVDPGVVADALRDRDAAILARLDAAIDEAGPSLAKLLGMLDALRAELAAVKP